MEEGEESEEDSGPFEEDGVLRLPLKPGTASGYVGVQRSTSKKRPWQATLQVAGRGRLNVGSFKQPRRAAVARAEAKLTNGDSLSSPRKQAARSSGVELRPAPPLSAFPFAECCSQCSPRLALVFSSQTLDCRGPHTPHAARCERDPFYMGKRRECAAECRGRVRCERSVHTTVCSCAWRAACPAASARPAIASGCGSFWAGLASIAAELNWA